MVNLNLVRGGNKMKDSIETIILKAKEDVYRLLQGSNFSKFLGQGYDFSELRTYDSSDDIRHISWINSAKFGEPYVKKMYEERELNVVVAVLIDGRMVISKKQEVMAQILAVLSYSALYANDILQSCFFIGDSFKQREPSKQIEEVEATLKQLLKIEPLGLALDYGQIGQRLLEKIEEKSLLFLVGDFLEEIDLSILAQKHEVSVLIVRDSWEETPTQKPEVQLVNPITNKLLSQTLSSSAIKHYKKKLEEHDQKLYAHFNEHKIRYVKIFSSEEIVQKLESLFYN